MTEMFSPILPRKLSYSSYPDPKTQFQPSKRKDAEERGEGSYTNLLKKNLASHS